MLVSGVSFACLFLAVFKLVTFYAGTQEFENKTNLNFFLRFDLIQPTKILKDG